jgi:hypothetical protein
MSSSSKAESFEKERLVAVAALPAPGEYAAFAGMWIMDAFPELEGQVACVLASSVPLPGNDVKMVRVASEQLEREGRRGGRRT